MPPRWPRKPDRNDPAFRKLDDRMTFAVHVALFGALNSGLWFFRQLGELQNPGTTVWPWTLWVTTVWAGVLVGHGLYIFKLANYSPYGKPMPDTAGDALPVVDDGSTHPSER
jgi:hypothetical protein